MTPIEAGRTLDMLAQISVRDGEARTYDEGFAAACRLVPGIAATYAAPALPLSLPAAPGRSRPPKTVADPGDEIDALAVEMVERGQAADYGEALHQVIADPVNRHVVEAYSAPGGC